MSNMYMPVITNLQKKRDQTYKLKNQRKKCLSCTGYTTKTNQVKKGKYEGKETALVEPGKG